MAPPAVGVGTLSRLAELDTDGRPVLSVYLDLDPPAIAACEAELAALTARLPPRTAEADIARVREMLRSMPAFAYGTRGLAMFSYAQGSEFAAVPLPASVGALTVLDRLLWLEPLAAMSTRGDWGVAVLGRQAARLFRGGPRALVEFAAFDQEPCRALAKEGSRRTRCAQQTGEQRAHARQLAARLLRAHRRQAFDDLVVIAPIEGSSVIEVALHSDLRERLAGLVELDIEHARAREILSVVAPVAERAQRDLTARTRHASGRALATTEPAVGTRLIATRFLQQLQQARRTARSDYQSTRSTRWGAPRSGQKEDAACP
jgi:Bacterial archaeo-eukaryotic release factor family 10